MLANTRARSKKRSNARSASLAVIAGSLEAVNRHQILDMATRNRLPVIYPRIDFVNNGGLMSYGAETEAPRRAALMVDKILKGSKPADLPVEQASKFDLVINLRAAKQIGLTIPQSVLGRADRVIKQDMQWQSSTRQTLITGETRRMLEIIGRLLFRSHSVQSAI